MSVSPIAEFLGASNIRRLAAKQLLAHTAASPSRAEAGVEDTSADAAEMGRRAESDDKIIDGFIAGLLAGPDGARGPSVSRELFAAVVSRAVVRGDAARVQRALVPPAAAGAAEEARRRFVAAVAIGAVGSGTTSAAIALLAAKGLHAAAIRLAVIATGPAQPATGRQQWQRGGAATAAAATVDFRALNALCGSLALCPAPAQGDKAPDAATQSEKEPRRDAQRVLGAAWSDAFALVARVLLPHQRSGAVGCSHPTGESGDVLDLVTQADGVRRLRDGGAVGPAEAASRAAQRAMARRLSVAAASASLADNGESTSVAGSTPSSSSTVASSPLTPRAITRLVQLAATQRAPAAALGLLGRARRDWAVELEGEAELRAVLFCCRYERPREAVAILEKPMRRAGLLDGNANSALQPAGKERRVADAVARSLTPIVWELARASADATAKEQCADLIARCPPGFKF
jgi:hypothetical protein